MGTKTITSNKFHASLFEMRTSSQELLDLGVKLACPLPEGELLKLTDSKDSTANITVSVLFAGKKIDSSAVSNVVTGMPVTSTVTVTMQDGVSDIDGASQDTMKAAFKKAYTDEGVQVGSLTLTLPGGKRRSLQSGSVKVVFEMLTSDSSDAGIALLTSVIQNKFLDPTSAATALTSGTYTPQIDSVIAVYKIGHGDPVGFLSPPPPTPQIPPSPPPPAWVQDKLEYYFDAGNPASIDPKGDLYQWKSLVGSSVATEKGTCSYDLQGGGSLVTGSTCYYDVPETTAFTQAGEITLEAWALLSSYASYNTGIVTNFKGGAGKFNWMFTQSTKFHNNGFKGSTYSPTGKYTTNTWYQLVLRFKTGVGYEFFVDGQKVHTQSVSGNLARTSGGKIGIGAREDGAEKANAKWGAVRIYTKALSDAELAMNYQFEKDRFGHK